MTEKVFTEGYYPKKVADTAPAYIVGDVSIHIETFTKFLEKVKGYADEKGYIRLTIKDSQAGKRYAELNTWRPSETAQVEEKHDDFVLPTINPNLGEVDPKVVPEL